MSKYEKNITLGWIRKQKGFKSFALKQRLLNLYNIHIYTNDGPTDKYENLISGEYSFKNKFAKYSDFVNEQTSL